MILKIKEWCEELVVAIILCIIIESLIPKGNNKKYVKLIIGIYVMYVMINPILNLINYDLNLGEKLWDLNTYTEVSTDISADIKDIYITGIEEDLKMKVKELGYDIDNIEVHVDENYENIEKIEFSLSYQKNNSIVNKIIIDDRIENESNKDVEIIKQYINENYNLEDDKILLK